MKRTMTLDLGFVWMRFDPAVVVEGAQPACHDEDGWPEVTLPDMAK